MSKRHQRHNAAGPQFYLDRQTQKQLIDLLRKIPDLVWDLEIASTKQSRLGSGRGENSRPKRPSEQPLLYLVDATDAADNLADTVAEVAHIVCKRRHIAYVPIGFVSADFIGPLRQQQRRVPADYIDDTTGYALWLDRHVTWLATLDDAKQLFERLRDTIRRAETVACPPFAEAIDINEERVEAARYEHLNAHGIAVAAKELGEEYRNLTERRVHVLRAAGKIQPVAVSLSKAWQPWWPAQYRLGDVLDAHLKHPIRRRHTDKIATA